MLLIFTIVNLVISACNINCPDEWLGDGYCDLVCMSTQCEFDRNDCAYVCEASGCTKSASDGTCDNACNVQECGLDYGDCNLCGGSCTQTLLQNNVCDPECDSYNCDFDNQHCGYCASGCFLYMLGDGVCQSPCNNPACYYDAYECTSLQCSPGCWPSWIGDNYCDFDCYNAECSWDNTDCICNAGCTVEMLSNDVCDQECNTESCNFDMNKCGDCAPGCFNDMLKNDICDIQCQTVNCNNDYLDCDIRVVYFNPLLNAAGTGTNVDPFNDFSQALTSSIGESVLVYLMGGDISLAGLSGNLLQNSQADKTEISALYCTTESVSGCFASNIRPVIDLADSYAYFQSSSYLLMKNIIFTHNYLNDPSCADCSYCRYTVDDDDGKKLDDRNVELTNTEYISIENCNSYRDFIFIISQDKMLKLKNIDFNNMRMQFKAFIAFLASTVLLENVNFYNVETSSTGYAIWSISYESSAISYTDLFNYTGGRVELVNNGFEIISGSSLGNFMKLSNLKKITISNLVLQYNIFSESASILLKFINCFMVLLTNLTVSNNFSSKTLIHIDNSELSMPIDSSGTYQNNPNIVIQDSLFQNNTAESLISLSYAVDCQTVLIANNNFQFNLMKSSLISSVYAGVLPNVCVAGGKASVPGAKKKTILNPRFMNLTFNNFTYNSALNMISISNIPNLNITNTVASLNANILTPTCTFSVFILQPKIYLTLIPQVPKIPCGSLFTLTHVNFQLFSFNNFTGNTCQIAKFTLAAASLIISNSVFSYNLLDRKDAFLLIDSAVKPIITNLEFYNNSFVNQGLGMIQTNPQTPLTFEFLNLYFYNSSGGLYINNVNNLLVNNLTVVKSQSILYSGLYFIGGSSVVTIKSSTFMNNNGNIISILGTSSAERTEVIMESCSFFYNSGSNTMFILDASLKLTDSSRIFDCLFSNNSVTAFEVTSTSGELTMENMKFSNNWSTNIVVLELSGASGLTVKNSLFVNNTGDNLMMLSFRGTINTINTISCEFYNNSGHIIKAYAIIYNDFGSIFKHNSANNSVISYLSDGAKGNFNKAIISNNNIGGFGVIIVTSMSKLIIADSKFENNYSLSRAGVIYNDQGSVFTILNSLFYNNSSPDGSCIYSQHTNPLDIISSVFNTTFKDNFARTSGTISLLEASILINSSIFDGNKAEMYPAIEVRYYSYLEIINTTFTSHIGEGAQIIAESKSVIRVSLSKFLNRTTNSCCGIFYVSDSILECKNCVISSANAKNTSGIYCDKSICSFIDSEITEVNTGLDGEIISIDNNAILILTSTVISHFTGTALYVGRISNLLLTNTTISCNFNIDGKSLAGTGIYCDSCDSFNISNSLFSNLISHFLSGCITSFQSYSSSLNTINSSRFESCSGKIGGAIYIYDTQLYMKNNTFSRNSAIFDHTLYSGQGGAVFLVYPSKNFSSIIDNCAFIENSATISGGGLQWYNNKPNTTTSIFQRNSAYYGPDIASFPYFAARIQGRALSVPEFAPGQTIPYPIIIHVYDHYKQIVLTDNYTSAQISTVNQSSYMMLGNSKAISISGKINFTDITIYGIPNSTVMMSLTCDFSSAGGAEKFYLEEEGFLRDCFIGEDLSGGDSCIVCAYNTYNLEAGAICNACPTGAICLGGRNIIAASGYWRTDNMSDIFYECPNPAACLQESLDWNKPKCLSGYRGNLCNSCDVGYSRSGNSECSQCMDQGRNIGILIGLFLILVIIIAVLTASNILGAYKEQSITSIYFKILMNYLQVVALTISFNLDWPSLVKKMFEIQGKATGGSDQLFSIDCFIGNSIEPYYAKLVSLSLMPLFFGIFTTLFWIIWGKLKKSQDLKQKIYGSIIVQLFFFQPSLVKYNFSMFHCMSIGPGKYFMTGDLSIECWKSTHLFYSLMVALPSLSLWCFMIPLVLVALLFKNRNNLKNIPEKIKYGFLYKGFKPNIYYWEFIIYLRKILIISCSVFLGNVSVNIQALTCFVVILLAYLMQVKARPYTVEQLNEMEQRAITVSAVTIYSGLYFLTKDLNEAIKTSMFVIMVTVNIYFLSYWIYYTFGFYIGKIYLKFCKKFLSEKSKKWLAKVVPDADLTEVEESKIKETEISPISIGKRNSDPFGLSRVKRIRIPINF